MTMIAQDLNESNTRGVEGIAHNTFLVTVKDRTFTFVGTVSSRPRNSGHRS
jgi:hypothetical protein